MKIIDVNERNSELIEKLEHVWYSSVLQTHTFLSKQDIDKIARFIPDALQNVETLVIAEEEPHCVAFMGIEACRLEMLFIAPEYIGQGLGRKLVEYGFSRYHIDEVTVNEQNLKALGFYKHMGFKVYKRTDTDGQGGPFPILYMRKSARGSL